MPDMAITDAHHHIWRQSDLPWLMGPMQPRIFGPYEPLRRDYPIAEFLPAIAGQGVTRAIYVQTNWAPGEEVRETRWVQSVAEVAERGLVFEFQLFTAQFADGARLAKDFPNATIVLEHAGMLEDDTPAGRAAWAEGLKRLAENANVSTKLPGLGTFVQRCDGAGIADIMHQAVAIFGAERCMFGSNFPIEKLWTGYADLLTAHLAAAANYGEPDRRAIFHDTAARIYRL